ncbi:MAG: aconitase family protein, partial [Fidelibacterota bacterium]
IRAMHAEGRLTLTNMAVEAGAKNAIMAADHITLKYLEGKTTREPKYFFPDRDAEYEREIEIDISELEPQVALPSSPDNVVSISEVGKIKVDQVFIGSCTNNRIEDFRSVTSVLKYRRIHPDLRMIVIPGSPRIFQKMLSEGILSILVESGALIGPPTCGPCIGGHMGVLAKGEVGVFTTNRNFVGRNGHPESKVYLVSPAVAAATAVKGYLADPRNI